MRERERDRDIEKGTERRGRERKREIKQNKREREREGFNTRVLLAQKTCVLIGFDYVELWGNGASMSFPNLHRSVC